MSLCWSVISFKTPGGAKFFREGPKFLEQCQIFLNYVQHIFPGEAKNLKGDFATPDNGPVLLCSRRGKV